MGRRFESYRAHQISFWHSCTCSFSDHLICSDVFHAVPRIVPTQPGNCFQDSLIGRVNVSHGHGERCPAHYLAECPSIHERSNTCSERVPQTIEHEWAQGGEL